jgi:hypothetical protein
MAHYSTLTNRKFDLDTVSEPERQFLSSVLERYRTEPDWSEFSNFWVGQGQRTVWKDEDRAKVVSSNVWRICQDLEMRLGTRQGKVAFPDYRDFLLDIIETRFGSRYKFCKQMGVDEGFLSKVIAGDKDFSMSNLAGLLDKLGLALVIGEQEAVISEADQALEGLHI